jgi:heat shock protein HtpX
MGNMFRTFLLLGGLTVLFVWVGGELGGRNGAIIAFIVATAMNFFAYWFSDKMVLRRYRVKEITPKTDSRLYEIVAKLVPQAGVPMPKVYMIPDKAPNAFATGRNPKNAAIAATAGILSLLDDTELSGVMAHELAHIKHRDILTGTIAATLAGAVAMITRL